MEQVKSFVHLHGAELNKEIVQITGKSQFSFKEKKANCFAVYSDPSAPDISLPLGNLESLYSTFSAGGTSGLICMGANSSNVCNYPRLKLLATVLLNLQTLINEESKNDQISRLSIAYLGVSDSRAVNLYTERTIDCKLLVSTFCHVSILNEALFLQEGLDESFFEAKSNLVALAEKLETGTSMPGILISIRLERISIQSWDLIDAEVEKEEDVFFSLSKNYSPSHRSSVSYFNLFDLGSVRFCHDSPQVSSMSESVAYLLQYFKYGNSDKNCLYKTIFNQIFTGNVCFLVDLELKNLNSEVESAFEFINRLSNFKVSSLLNTLDSRIPVLYQMISKYKKLKAELKGQKEENEVINNLAERLKARMEEKSEKLQLAQKRLDEQKRLADDFESQLAVSNNQIVQLEEEIVKINEKSKNVSFGLRNAEKEARKEIESARNDIENLKKSNKKLSESVEIAEKELKELKKTDRLKDKEIEKLQRNASYSENFESLSQEYIQKTKDEAILRKKNEELESENQRLIKTIKHLESSISSTKDNVKVLSNKREIESDFQDELSKPKATMKRSRKKKEQVVEKTESSDDDSIQENDLHEDLQEKPIEISEKVRVVETMEEILSGPEDDSDLEIIDPPPKKQIEKKPKVAGKKKEKENSKPKSKSSVSSKSSNQDDCDLDEKPEESEKPRKRKLMNKKETINLVRNIGGPSVPLKPLFNLNLAKVGEWASTFSVPKMKKPDP